MKSSFPRLLPFFFFIFPSFSLPQCSFLPSFNKMYWARICFWYCTAHSKPRNTKVSTSLSLLCWELSLTRDTVMQTVIIQGEIWCVCKVSSRGIAMCGARGGIGFQPWKAVLWNTVQVHKYILNFFCKPL